MVGIGGTDDEQLGGSPVPASATTSVEVHWHLNEVGTALRDEPGPLSPELFRIVLRGLAELCGLLFEHKDEAPAQPPSLFRNDRAVAEELAMWETRIRFAIAEQQPRAATTQGGGSTPP